MRLKCTKVADAHKLQWSRILLSTHRFSGSHDLTSYRFLCLLLVFLAPTVVAAEEPSPPKVVALDHSTADLLRACFPAMEFQVLVRFENEPNAAINRRAWLTRDADVLVFRSDQISIRSRLFRERLMTQGIRVVDLHAHISINRTLQFRLDAVGPKCWRSNLERSTAHHSPATAHQVATTKPVSSLPSQVSYSSDVDLSRGTCPPCNSKQYCEARR